MIPLAAVLVTTACGTRPPPEVLTSGCVIRAHLTEALQEVEAADAAYLAGDFAAVQEHGERGSALVRQGVVADLEEMTHRWPQESQELGLSLQQAGDLIGSVAFTYSETLDASIDQYRPAMSDSLSVARRDLDDADRYLAAHDAGC